MLVSLPTGTGKTVVFAALPAFFKMQKRMLVLAHREDLLAQAAAKFAAVAPELTVGIEQGSRPANARIVLASVPTVGREASSRLLRLPPDDFYLIVVDEAHHAVAAIYRRVVEHFGLFAEGIKRLLVGFTAMPRRGDKQALSEVFEEIAYARSLPEMVREGYLCPVRAGACTPRSTSRASACDMATSSRAICRERSMCRSATSSSWTPTSASPPDVAPSCSVSTSRTSRPSLPSSRRGEARRQPLGSDVVTVRRRSRSPLSGAGAFRCLAG